MDKMSRVHVMNEMNIRSTSSAGSLLPPYAAIYRFTSYAQELGVQMAHEQLKLNGANIEQTAHRIYPTPRLPAGLYTRAYATGCTASFRRVACFDKGEIPHDFPHGCRLKQKLKVDRHKNKNKRVELFHSNIMVTYSSSHFELLVDGLNEM